MQEQKKGKEADGDTLYTIHHEVFKWLRVVSGEHETHINQI